MEITFKKNPSRPTFMSVNDKGGADLDWSSELNTKDSEKPSWVKITVIKANGSQVELNKDKSELFWKNVYSCAGVKHPQPMDI